MRVPSHRVPYPPESVGACGLEGLEHRLDGVAEIQVGVPDYRSGRTGWAVQPALTGRSQTLDELDLAYGLHLVRTAGPVHCTCLNEHGGADVVSAVHVVSEFVQQVSLVRDALRAKIPEVVVRIADRKIGFEGLLFGQREPVVSAERHGGASIVVCSGPIVSQRIPGGSRGNSC